MSRDRLRRKVGFYRNAAKQAIPTGVWTPQVFDTNDIDTDNWHPLATTSTTIASGSNNQQLTGGSTTINVASTTGFPAGTSGVPAYATIVGAGTHQAVRAATTVTGTLASAYENGDSIDGVTLATGNRILLKNQTGFIENGIYTVNASGAPTRATDMDASGELYVGTGVWVTEGATNIAKRFHVTATGAAPWVPGTSTSTWAQDTTAAETLFRYTATPGGTSFGSATLGSTWLSTGMVVKVANVDITLQSTGLYSIVAEAMWTLDGEKTGVRGVRLVSRASGLDFTLATQDRPADGLTGSTTEAVQVTAQPYVASLGGTMRVDVYQSSTRTLNSVAAGIESPAFGGVCIQPAT